MRRGENHLFKGSVFVEFSTVDEAKAFVATEALKYNEQDLIKMRINDTVIDQKPEITFLGVTLDDQLSFSSHVSNVCRKASSQTGVLLRLRNPIPTSAKLHIIKFAGYPISHTVKLSGISVVLLMPRNLNEFKNEHYALCTLTTNRRTMNSCMERMYQHFIRGDYKLLQS